MNTTMKKGIAVAVLHAAIVASVGAKLLVDRATRPRVWARTVPVDPDSPLRGRYVRLQVEGEAVGLSIDGTTQPVRLEVRNNVLTAVPPGGESRVTARPMRRDGREVAVLTAPVAFFIPEHVPDPSIRPAGEELWVELTLPKSGPPRPIRLGVRKDGVLQPLE